LSQVDAVSSPENIKILPFAAPQILQVKPFDNLETHSGNSTGIK
jgi:hypothetical protein